MKTVAIIGLGWLGMPLALALTARGWQVTGSKTTSDGVEAARLCGINSYQLELTPEVVCDAGDLGELLRADVLVVTLPASRTIEGSAHYMQAVQNIVDSALAGKIPRIIFTSSTSVYGRTAGVVNEFSPLRPETAAGKTLVELESWLHDLPGTSVDILRLAGLVGPHRHPGRFLAGKSALPDGSHGVNLVHLEDVVRAIIHLLQMPEGGHIYNLCAAQHPPRRCFYPTVAHQLGLTSPQFLPDDEQNGGRLIDGAKICRDLGFSYRWPDPFNMPVS